MKTAFGLRNIRKENLGTVTINHKNVSDIVRCSPIFSLGDEKKICSTGPTDHHFAFGDFFHFEFDQNYVKSAIGQNLKIVKNKSEYFCHVKNVFFLCLFCFCFCFVLFLFVCYFLVPQTIATR